MLLETESKKAKISKIRKRKKLSSEIIATNQTSEIHDFLPKIESSPILNYQLTIQFFQRLDVVSISKMVDY